MLPLILACVLGAPAPNVEVEETLYVPKPADNGAGPLWCYGSTCIVRVGNDVFVSGIETLPNAKPLNNVRWVLYQRTDSGWRAVHQDEVGRTREPCPLAAFSDGRLYLSANPTLTPPDTYNGPSRPEVVRFSAKRPDEPPVVLQPAWEGRPAFTEHSYRGLCADGPGRMLLLFNIVGHEAHYISTMDATEKWAARGRAAFPMGTEYARPEPIRLAYPVLALRNRQAHVLAISDIIEPVPEWREFKLKLNQGRAWDYDFRRLFYAWTPDITRQPFGQWVEVASREKTCGQITNLDIWLDRRGRAYLLWLERSIWYPQMRDVFFPGTPLTVSLEMAIVEKGTVVQRATLAKGGEGASAEEPGYGRFHATPDGRLYVFAYFGGSVSENRLLELDSRGGVRSSVRVPLEHPFTSFMTATERGGSAPSHLLDVMGHAAGRPGISYARIRLRR